MSEIRPCPCGSGSDFFGCCDPVIRGAAEAQTAEQLLRARYTAFATGAVDFIISSTHPEKRDGVNPDATREWSEGSTWTGLDILKTGSEGEGVDYVCFEARYTQGGKNVRHREKSRFERVDGRWFFTTGVALKQPTVRYEQPKVGRNEPCTCGSGRKFKKCCGAVAA